MPSFMIIFALLCFYLLISLKLNFFFLQIPRILLRKILPQFGVKRDFLISSVLSSSQSIYIIIPSTFCFFYDLYSLPFPFLRQCLTL
jgi:hypothetical protein